MCSCIWKCKFSIEEAWDEVARKVNVHGPPERSGYEWKKVWTDLKCRTKKKICENHKIINTCGEGSSRLIYLSELEQSVDRILNFSTLVASQVLDESLKDFGLEIDANDQSKSSKVNTQRNDSEPTIEISKASANKKPKSQNRLLGKRKYEKIDKQLRLLQQQIKAQEKILDAIQIQATATNAIVEITNRQAESMAIIAESTQSIALRLQEAVKYFKSV